MRRSRWGYPARRRGRRKRRKKSSSFGNGAVEAWTDEVVDRVGGASQGCVCSARLVELTETDRYFFSEVNRESRGVLEYAGVDVLKLSWGVFQCSSISTLEWLWNNHALGRER